MEPTPLQQLALFALVVLEAAVAGAFFAIALCTMLVS